MVLWVDIFRVDVFADYQTSSGEFNPPILILGNHTNHNCVSYVNGTFKATSCLDEAYALCHSYVYIY